MADQIKNLFNALKDLIFVVQKPKPVESTSELTTTDKKDEVESKILYINDACSKNFGLRFGDDTKE